MHIHEYQAKGQLHRFALQKPPGASAYSPEQATCRIRELGGNEWLVKARLHAGGTGLAGGVTACCSDSEIQPAREAMFGQMIVRHQTNPGSAAETVDILSQAGVTVAPHPAQIGAAIARVLAA